jgi:hypothetical protein
MKFRSSPLRSDGFGTVRGKRLDCINGGQRHTKTELSSKGPSGLSPLRSQGSHDGQVGGWTVLTLAKDTQGRVGKKLQEVKGPN